MGEVDPGEYEVGWGGGFRGCIRYVCSVSGTVESESESTAESRVVSSVQHALYLYTPEQSIQKSIQTEQYRLSQNKNLDMAYISRFRVIQSRAEQPAYTRITKFGSRLVEQSKGTQSVDYSGMETRIRWRPMETRIL